MERSTLRRLNLWLGLVLVAGGLLFFALSLWPGWRSDVGDFFSSFRIAGAWPLMALSLAAALASQVFAPCAWERIVASISQRGAGLRRSEVRRNWYITQMGSYIPGKVWTFAGRTAFLGSRGIGAGHALAAIILENIFLMVAVCLLALLALPFAGNGALPSEARMPLAVSALALLAVLFAPGLRARVASVMASGSLKGRLDLPGLPYRSQGWIVWRAMLSWAFRSLSLFLWFLAAGAGAGEGGRMLAASMIAIPVSWLASIAWVLVPGGIGVRESIQGLVMAGFTGGVPVAVTVALAHRVILIAAEGSFALGSMLAVVVGRRWTRVSRAFGLLAAMAGAMAARAGLRRPPLPVNVTFSVTRRCQSRCLTCGIWKADDLCEMDLEAIERLFRSMGWTWFFNISGGEPYLRDDLPEIVRLAARHLGPAVIHVPTNALMPDRIEDMTRRMLAAIREESPGTLLTVKPSFDGIGERHDEIRGVPGNFRKLLDTLARLKALRDADPSLHVGVGTVVSRFNESELEQIIEYAGGLGVDTYINEIAEERQEFFNEGSEITPDPATYSRIMEVFKRNTLLSMKGMRALGRITSGLRLVYYDLVVRILTERRQVVPCYAGLLNVHINADGAVWPCAIRAYGSEMGRIGRDGDFREVWESPSAAAIRKSIRRGECWCPLANQAYSNILMHPPSLLAALVEALRGGRGRRSERDGGPD